MKRKFTGILFIMLALILSGSLNFSLAKENASKTQAVTPKYVVFTNFDPIFADSAYFVNFNYEYNLDYKPKAIEANFSTFFNQYKLTDFDVAIIPLGDQPLSTAVLTRIYEMVHAGKGVLLTGREALLHAFDFQGMGSSADVKSFFKDTLKIKYLLNLPVSSVSGNTKTRWSFEIRGEFGDPVGGSVTKWCNEGYIDGGGNTSYPLATEDAVNVFKLTDSVNVYPVEHYIKDGTYPRTDTLVAMRAQIDTGRIVFYSMGWEAYASFNSRATLLQRVMAWLTENIRPDGPALSVEPVNIDFQNVPPDSTVEMVLNLKSIGTSPLTITETSFFDDANGVYTISKGAVSSNKPLTLTTGKTYPITIKFKPSGLGDFVGILSVYSNDIMVNIKNISVTGVGAKSNNVGPKLTINLGTNIDFGSAQPNQSISKNLVLYNTGDADLEISTFKIDSLTNIQQAFTFQQVIKVPFVIKPGDSATFKLRYGGRADTISYTAHIDVTTNALNNPKFVINLLVKVKPNGIEDPISIRNDGLLSMKISPNPATDNALLEYTLNGTNAYSPEIILVDLNGRKIKTLTDGMIAPGAYRKEFNTVGIPTGSYFIVAYINGENSGSLSLIINK